MSPFRGQRVGRVPSCASVTKHTHTHTRTHTEKARRLASVQPLCAHLFALARSVCVSLSGSTTLVLKSTDHFSPSFLAFLAFLACVASACALTSASWPSTIPHLCLLALLARSRFPLPFDVLLLSSQPPSLEPRSHPLLPHHLRSSVHRPFTALSCAEKAHPEDPTDSTSPSLTTRSTLSSHHRHFHTQNSERATSVATRHGFVYSPLQRVWLPP